MPNPFQTPEFKILFHEWNQTLKDSGFEDAEDFSFSEPQLKSWHNFKFKNTTEEEIKQAAVYDSMAKTVLHSHRFETPIHRRVWELHIAGKSIRRISAEINQRRFGRDVIFLLIQKIQRMYGLRQS